MLIPEEISLTSDGTVPVKASLGYVSFELPVDLASGTIQIKNKYGRVRHEFSVGTEDENHEIQLLINDTETTVTSSGVDYPKTIVIKSSK